MPPKGKGKGKGKAKLSKAEKEKLKKEEAERKAQEEEEARIKAEIEEKEREERERQEREVRRLFEEQERERHQVEVDELNSQLEANKQYLSTLKRKEIENKKWNRYMLCDGRPDPTCKKDINTFINLTREDDSNKDIGKVLKKCELILELINELDQHLNQKREELSQEEDGNIDVLSNQINCYAESKLDLQNLIFLKVDDATWQLLKSPIDCIDLDTLNIQHVEKSEHIKLCLWGNAAKNPRVKQVEFDKDEFTMELPKQMALASIAARILYVDFDFISTNCSTYAYKQKKKGELPEPTVEIEEIEGEVGEDRNSKLDSSLNADPSNAKAMLGVNELSVKESTASKSRTGTAASKISVRKGGSRGVLEVTPTQEIHPDVSTAAEEQLATDIEDVDEDDLLDEDVIDLRSFAPMGPIVYIELLQLPPQAKEMNGWTMQQVTNKSLQKIVYRSTSRPSDSSVTQSSLSIKSAGKESSTLGYDLPIGFSIGVDRNVLFYEPPLIARWEEETQHWKTSEITDIRYEEEEKMMFFRTACFGPFAIMQDIYLNMPFQSWQLRPTGLNECVFTIVGANTEVDILIKENKCSVKFPEEITQISHLVGQWMKPQALIQALRSVGVNVFPYEDGNKYVSVCKKVDGLINQLYQQMALSASCFSYTWSKWNNDCGDEKVVVQATEWNSPRMPPEEAYHLYMASTRICYKLNMTEYSNEFSTDVFPQSQMHPDLYHMLRDGANENTVKLLKDSSVVFIDCVHQLLMATNIFVYS